MLFRLTYEGPLRPSQRDPINGQSDRLADHKHEIRKHFHKQLANLWKSNQFLNTHKVFEGRISTAPLDASRSSFGFAPDEERYVPLRETVAKKYSRDGYRYVPLVCKDHTLLCSLEILFLKRDFPGTGLVHAGDLDNRLKTLIDALRITQNTNELGKYTAPDKDEDPFYCLLEDDSLVTSFSLTSDALLTHENKMDRNDVKLVISVNIQPRLATNFNVGFL